MSEAVINALIARSSASGWVLCVLAAFGIWRLYVLARPEMRKLEIGESEALRTAFVAEMKALREEISGLRDENESLRKEVRELHGVIDGMRRDRLQEAISTQTVVARAMPDGHLTREMIKAVDKLDNITGTKGAGG